MGQLNVLVCDKCGEVGREMCGRGMLWEPESLETRILSCAGCGRIEIVTMTCEEWSRDLTRCKVCGTYMGDVEDRPYHLRCPRCGEISLHLKAEMMFD